MRQYEMVWRSGFDYFCRTRDTETREVFFEKITPEFEYFVEDREGDYRFILDQNKRLKKKSFKNSKEAKEFRNLMESVGQEIYGGQSPEYLHIRKNFFRNGLDVDTRIWFFDIEVISKEKTFPDPQVADQPITQIQIYDSYVDKIFLLSLDDFEDKTRLEKYENLVFKKFDTEEEMAKVFLKMLEKAKPTVITAWNGDYFDFPYVTNRFRKLKGVNVNKLSPIHKISDYRTKEGLGFRWEGVYLIDMMQSYKKFIFTPQTSYSLENIAKVELNVGEGKVDYGEFLDIIDFYHGNKDKFLEYAIQDVVVLKKLEDKLKLIALMKIMAYDMGINFDDTMGTVKPWSQYLTNIAMEDNLVMPLKNKNKLSNAIVGGYVRDPKVGKNSWVVSIDVNSQYPLLGMRAFNMSPETYVNVEEMPEELLELRKEFHVHEDESVYADPEVLKRIKHVCKKYDVAYGINAFFKREKEGIIPTTVGDIYKRRKEAKGKMLAYNALKARIL